MAAAGPVAFDLSDFVFDLSDVETDPAADAQPEVVCDGFPQEYICVELKVGSARMTVRVRLFVRVRVLLCVRVWVYVRVRV